MTPTELYDAFADIVETGDEAAARAFLAEHINEFPEETRNELISTFLTEAISEEARTIEARAEFQKEVLAALDDVKGARNEIENQKRIEELKQQVKGK